ncbi:MAG: hypothetical protein M3536_06545 [Actinomycetota bacterium]|nr:hypothetical protein [Actinomycetota bacterium]
MTNYAAVAGTGGTAALTNQTTAGYSGNNFNRVTWSVATTSPSGGAKYTQTGLAAATQYSHQVWVRSSKAQTVNLSAQYQNSSAVNVGAAVVSANVVLTANVWTQLKVEGATSGAAVDRVVLTAAAASAGVNWANTDTLDIDAVMIETGATCGTYSDGSFVNANSIMYAWTGTANASTSTAKTYTPVIALVEKPTFDPCPRVEVTITDVTPTDNVVNVWRTADGKRQAVRGARKFAVNGSNFITDYEAPLGRSVAYDLEITSGLNLGAGATQQTVTVNAASGCIQDPLVPSSAVPLYENASPNGEPMLQGQAISSLEYASGMNLMQVIGSPDPVALMGQRLSAANVDFSMVTAAAQQATTLRNLLKQAPLLLVRPLTSFGASLPGLCYMASAKPVEMPQFTRWDGTVTKWQLSGDLVAAPTMNVLVPIWTYGTVAALWTTYQAAQTALAAKTYLDVLKSPSGT